MDREYEPVADDDREEPLDEALVETPPPTIDPDERIEEAGEPTDAVGIDDERPA